MFPAGFDGTEHRTRCETYFPKWTRRIGILAALLVAPSVLFGCTFIKSDSCADQANLPSVEKVTRGCEGSFFSARSQREAVYLGDDSARLWAGAEYRRAPNIDPGGINQAPSAGAPIAAWSGSVKVAIADDENVVRKDIADIQSAGADKFNPDEKVTVNFEKASIGFFLKQMLSGALGVSYVAPDDLAGSVTFRTEQPILKGQVLQVVRDVLARNGLEMRYMSGVYQIGTPEVMASLEATTAPGRRSDQVPRLVRLRKANADEVINFVRQLVPDDVNLVAATGRNLILVKASPDEIGRVADLIAMSDSSLSDDRVAIIPLRASAPETIARQLTDFYHDRAEAVTIIPLDNQQAILAGTKDRRTLRGLKELVDHLDHDTGSDSTLRIIPLVYIGADEVVPLLTAVFAGPGAAPAQGSGSGYANPGPSSQTTGGQAIVSAGPGQQNTGGRADGVSSANNTRAPDLLSALTNNNGASANKNPNNTTAPANAANQPAPVIASAGPGIKFVADTRNNAVMIYSSYATYKLVKQRLKVLDVPQAQVVIEAAVAEVTLNDELSHGVEAFLTASGLGASSSANGTMPTTGAGGFVHLGFTTAGAQADVILRALQDVTNVKVISTPYLTVVDGKKARLQIGDQVPFQTVTATVPTNGAPIITQEVTVKDTGVVLEIVPRIRPNNAVVLDINQSVSNVKENNTANVLTPTISTRQVQSDVIIQSGSTIMLGGLIKEGSNLTETGIPIARNIPLVGDLFKQRTDVGDRQELIILITPRVIRHSIQLENITRQMRTLVHIRR